MAKRRTKLEQARDVALVAELARQGHTQKEMGERLGLSQSQVSRTLSRLQQQWLQDTSTDIALERGVLDAALGLLEKTAWEAYHQSQEPRKRVVTHTHSGDRPLASQEVIGEERLGNPAFLQLVLGCAGVRCRLWGLYHGKPRSSGRRRAHPPAPPAVPRSLREVNLLSILLELERRYGIIEIYHRPGPSPGLKELPPDFRPPF